MKSLKIKNRMNRENTSLAGETNTTSIKVLVK